MTPSTLIGRTVDHDRYRLTRYIGAGGMGEVYEAEDTQLPRRVAVKTIKRGLDDPDYARRFAREAMTIAQLDHPSIVKIYSYGSEQDFSYIVMQYLGGKSLADRLAATTTGERPQPSLSDISTLISTIAAALDYAHKRGVIHRDVKPANIMYDDEGYAFLVDFGIARPSGGSGEDSIGLSRAYTPNYAAPEQVMLQRATPKIDQYALATVAYAMAAGGLPYQGNSEVVQEKKAQEDPLPASHYRAQLPAGVVDVLAKGLARNPEKRYPTAGAFAAAFASAAGAESGAGTKRGLWVGAAALVVAMVAVTGIIATVLVPQTEQSPTEPSPVQATGQPPTEPQVAAALASAAPEIIFVPDTVTPFASAEVIGQTNATASPTASATSTVTRSPVPSATATPTVQPASATPSLTPTREPTVSPTNVPSETPDLDATATYVSQSIQATVEAALTITATSWTATPTSTPNLDATATWYEQIVQKTVEAVLTATASAWTPIPTATRTPEPTNTLRPTSTRRPSSTPRPTETRRATSTPRTTAAPARIIQSCSGAMPSRMLVGDRGQITYTDGSLTNLRVGPGTNNSVVVRMEEGTPFEVIDGPHCGAYAWWQIQLNTGTIGWVAEGIDGQYFIEPLLSDESAAPSITDGDQLRLGRQVSGHLDTGEVRHYSFQIAQNATYVTVVLTSSNFDTVLNVLSATGDVIVNDDDGGGNLDSVADFQAYPDMEYTIEVRSYGNEQSGDYELVAENGSAEALESRTTWAAYQQFERGYMIWTEYLDRIFVLYDSGTWDYFADQYTGQNSGANLNPPTMRVAPRNGIAIIWRQIDGLDALGWGMHEEVGFDSSFVHSPVTGNYTLSGPEGQQFMLNGDGTWQLHR